MLLMPFHTTQLITQSMQRDEWKANLKPSALACYTCVYAVAMPMHRDAVYSWVQLGGAASSAELVEWLHTRCLSAMRLSTFCAHAVQRAQQQMKMLLESTLQ